MSLSTRNPSRHGLTVNEQQTREASLEDHKQAKFAPPGCLWYAFHAATLAPDPAIASCDERPGQLYLTGLQPIYPGSPRKPLANTPVPCRGATAEKVMQGALNLETMYLYQFDFMYVPEGQNSRRRSSVLRTFPVSEGERENKVNPRPRRKERSTVETLTLPDFAVHTRPCTFRGQQLDALSRETVTRATAPQPLCTTSHCSISQSP